MKHKSAVHFAQYKSIMEIDKDCVRCPVCTSRQPLIIRRPIFFHHQPDKNEGKWQNDADSDDDGVPDPCSAESSDSDDCEETDAESSDDEDDDELHHSKSDDDCDFLNDNQQKFMRKIKLAVASQIREAFGEMQVITINKYIEKIIENIFPLLLSFVVLSNFSTHVRKKSCCRNPFRPLTNQLQKVKVVNEGDAAMLPMHNRKNHENMKQKLYVCVLMYNV